MPWIAISRAVTDEKPFGAQTFSNCASQIGDERPIPSVRFAPNGTLAMTGSWSGTCKLWDTSTTSLVRTLRGHKERVNDVVFHPCSGSTQSASILNAASCGADNTVQLWNLERFVDFMAFATDGG
mgnify:FL=1